MIKMRTYLPALMVLALLMAGCIGGGPAPKAPEGIVPGIIPQEPQAPECESSYTFSDLPDGKLSQSSMLRATVLCASGKDVALVVDGQEREVKSAPGNASTPLEFDVVALKDGVSQVQLVIDGEPEFSTRWQVLPLGNSKVSKSDYDPFSFKRHIAYGFKADNSFQLGHVRAYMKRLASMTQPGTSILVEVRKDSSGDVGDLLAQAKRPITDTTLSENWIRFDFGSKPTLQAGDYWVVFKIEQTENIKVVSDSVMLHYVVLDREKPNSFTLGMDLDVDKATGRASPSRWAPLAYSRDYSLTIHSAD